MTETAVDTSVVLDEAMSREIHRELADRGIVGGAAYDGLAGAAARSHDLTLATRDARDRGTYEAVQRAIDGRNQTVLAELEASYAVIGNVQFLPGYTLVR